MTGFTPLKERLCAAPLLPPRTDARALIRAELTDRLEDRGAAALIGDIYGADEKVAALIAGVLAHSPFLTRILRRHPDWLIESFDDDPDAQFAEILSHVLPVARQHPVLADAMRHLRTQRQRVALHIALADIGGVWPLENVVTALTAFADAAVDVALRLALREAAARGHIVLNEAFEHPGASGLVVLAMGKHGAGELNYSSDIDLIVIFDPARVPVVGTREPLEVAVRIVQDIVKVLHEQTGGGYVFRTDLRLRPDPASTPVAVSVERAIQYYQTVGQNWERAALIKARPIAGDTALGQAFLAELTPFIWRRYFDYAAIADIHAMKRQIHAHKGGAAIAIEGHDLKLGRGGIREIEFFVQTQQLVFGGKRPVLRGQQTMTMLEALCDEGWIGEDAVSALQAAYRHLRTLEHRLQMVEDEQTQRLARASAEVDRFAQFCGETPAEFRKSLLKHLQAVERHYARLFEDSPGLASTTGNLVFTGTSNDPETLGTLKRLGFLRPEVVAETVRGWHFGRRRAIVTDRAREVLTELTPPLLEALGRSSDPDGALLVLDGALQTMPAVVELFTILKQNAALLALFAEILGNAPLLADTVVQRPHVLDALVGADFAAPVLEADMLARFQARLRPLVSFEDFLDQLRDVARAERFAAGARLLSGVIDPVENGAAEAGIAAASINVALERVSSELAARHGRVPGAEMAIMALGKLGGREMTARSDLDLMVLYRTPNSEPESDGPKSLVASEWYARLTQRLLTALTAPTKRGTLYEVDLRLRPSGNKGPVAVSLVAFESYHAGESEIWELMALTRARCVAGDRAFGAEVEAAITSACGRERDGRVIARAIRTMRKLVAKEKPAAGPWDIKLAPGGLVDVEFAAQCLLLTHAASAPGVLSANTGEALSRLQRAGLVAPEVAAPLQAAWALQSALAQIIALTKLSPFDPAQARAPFLQRLAVAAGLPSFKVLEAHLKEVQHGAHEAMESVLGA
jgi:[glutamine synthetase] adenylyltransferase / [glutamine synthetase]-adenylyl-L-tyrosine phosphorylase